MKRRSDYISPWGYVGYTVLFCIPVVGLILLICFSFSRDDNRRNFARSFWCWLFVLALLALLVFAADKTFAASIVPPQVSDFFANLYESVCRAADWLYDKILAFFNMLTSVHVA